MQMVFLGRQPIFDRRKRVFGYELLYRSSQTQNAYNHVDGDQASRQVMHNTLNVLPMGEVTADRKAFINITRKLLVDQTYSVLPGDRTVVELLETVKVDDEVIAACKALKDAGYILALDDFVDEVEYQPLLEFTDILKIDFLSSDSARRKHFVDRYGGKNILLLAEKVETYDDYQEGYDLGYTYFQGYFFCKPEILSKREIPAFKNNYIRFLHEMQCTPLNFAKLEEIIKNEASLASKLLRYLNSSSIGLRQRLTSIRQALALLGEVPLRKWGSLAVLTALSEDKPPELLVTCLARARFCELIGPRVGLEGRELDSFLMGLFSTIDALTDQPLETVLSDIPLAADVSAALLGASTLLGQTYRLLLALERGNGAFVEMIAKNLKLSLMEVSEIYQQSLRWTDSRVTDCRAAA